MGNKAKLPRYKSIALRKNEAVSLCRLSSCEELVCLDGTIWVTFHGDYEDHLLKKGNHLEPKKRRHPVVYAIEKSEFYIRNLSSEVYEVTTSQSNLCGNAC